MLRMCLSIASAVTALALGSAANAATLTVITDQPSYQVGDTILLVVTGDAEGTNDSSIYGRLLFDNPSVADFASGDPNEAYVGDEWFVPEPLTCTPSSCVVFNHISLMQVPRTLPYLLTVYVSFPAVAPGVSNVNWDTDPFSGSGLDFFGLTDGAGTTIVVVPEPATAGLLALGLIGLARARQRSLS